MSAKQPKPANQDRLIERVVRIREAAMTGDFALLRETARQLKETFPDLPPTEESPR